MKSETKTKKEKKALSSEDEVCNRKKSILSFC